MSGIPAGDARARLVRAAEVAMATRWRDERLYNDSDPEVDAGVALEALLSHPEDVLAALGMEQVAWVDDGNRLIHVNSPLSKRELERLGGPRKDWRPVWVERMENE